MVLAQILEAASPEEGCALLLGRRRGTALELVDSWPCLNSWQPARDRHRRFALDPREQLLAQKWARARDLQVLGAAHSHPGSVAVPSATDRELCWGPTLMLILSGLAREAAATPENQGLRAWWIEAEGNDAPRELPIAITPAPGASAAASGLGE